MKTTFSFLFILLFFFQNTEGQDRGFVISRREAEDHIALVIGNGAYPEAPLGNPVNDAEDVAKAFNAMGFIVEKVTDADKEKMAQAIARFAEKIKSSRAAVFYYAGHGVQVNGENYLLPIGNTPASQITEESQVPYRSINAGEVLAIMEEAKLNFSLVVLDACRNNPFKGSGRGRVPGLASINAPVGSLVMYSTKAGSVASDGQNTRNSPFTTAFLKHVQTPGLDVNLLPSKISQTVDEITSGSQVPGTYMQLKSSFSFVPEMSEEEIKEMKIKELNNLKLQDVQMQQMELEASKKQAEEDSLMAVKQAEIDELDKQISVLKNKTSSSGSVSSDSDLDQILAYVKQKEAPKRELELLQKQAEERRLLHQKNLAEMKKKEYEEKLAKIKEDIDKYEQIAASEYGKDLMQTAWDNILTKWGLEKSTIITGATALLIETVCPNIFELKDSRDNQTYKVVEIGNQVWMAENLNFDVKDSWVYLLKNAEAKQKGRLYTYESANKACPTGWHLPSKSEFEILLSQLGSKPFLALKKEGNSGFNIVTGGCRDDSGNFYGFGEDAYYWTSTPYDKGVVWDFTILSGSQTVLLGYYRKNFGLSVRCLKD